jgi:hypothetical protein
MARHSTQSSHPERSTAKLTITKSLFSSRSSLSKLLLVRMSLLSMLSGTSGVMLLSASASADAAASLLSCCLYFVYSHHLDHQLQAAPAWLSHTPGGIHLHVLQHCCLQGLVMQGL